MNSTMPQMASWRDRRVSADIIQWDVATWRYGLDFWERRMGDLGGKRALDIGGRDGGLSLFLALHGCQVVCSDLKGPTDRARALHEAYGVAGLVSYEHVDARRIPFSDEHFDVVVLKSVLGALGNEDDSLAPQHEAVREIRRVLKQGGYFLFAENVRGSNMHALSRKYFVTWGRDWNYFKVEQVTELVKDFATSELLFGGFAAALGRREWQRSLLHELDRLLMPLLPSRSKYVVFGFAEK